MNRIFSMILLVTIIISLNVTFCFSVTKITFMNSKGEIQAQLEDAMKIFEKENPGISVDVITASVGQSPLEKITSLYASGNAPSLIMLDPADMTLFKDKMIDLSGEKWVKDLAPTASSFLVKSGKKLFGFPMTVEGYGFIYNKKLFAKAGIDAKKIKTLKDLEDSFKKLQNNGIGAIVISRELWSLAAHFVGTGYANYAKDNTSWTKIQQDQIDGKIDLTKNKDLNGLIDTFDVMKKYNILKDDPLGTDYPGTEQLFATGKAAVFFMGNWCWPDLAKFNPRDSDYAYLPVFVSNNAKDYGNNGINVDVTKFIGIEATQNNKEQQEAAKKVLNWFVYSKSGQDAIVNKAKIIPAFKNITLEPTDPLSKSIKSYLLKGQVHMFAFFPGDFWPSFGNNMQQYLAGKIDRTTLLKGLEDYWKSKKN